MSVRVIAQSVAGNFNTKMGERLNGASNVIASNIPGKIPQ